MIRYLTAAVAALALLAAPAAAQADVPVSTTCPTGWYVNDDEADRKPEPTEDGLKFTDADLIHHTVSGLAVADLKPGTFTLATGSDAPDQNSFFSVEVNGEGTGKYGTLRWNTDTSKWNMVANGGTFYEDADPAKVVAAAGKGTSVFSFGVGYTKNPPGTKTTVVSSVTFNGKTSDLTCKPKPSPSTSSPTATPTATKPTTTPATTRPPTSPTSSPVPGAGTGDGGTSTGEGLPVTGSSAGVLAAWASAVLLIGAGLFVLARRRRNRFVA